MFKKTIALLMAAALLATSGGCAKKDPDTGDIFAVPKDGYAQLNGPQTGDTIAIMTTSMGVMKIHLFPDVAPKTVENFTTHAKNGYYDNTIFHRVMEDFMIQGGDPTGTGSGGESIWGADFEDEFSPQAHNLRGALSMANAGYASTNSCQFFIVQRPASLFPDGYFEPLRTDAEEDTQWLDGSTVKVKDIWPAPFIEAYETMGGTPELDYKHTVFGQIYEGLDVLDAIIAVPKTENNRGEVAVPVDPVYILSISIETY